MFLRSLTLSLIFFTSIAFGQQYPFLKVPGSPANVQSMLLDSKGRLWIGTYDDVLCFDGSRFYSLRPLGFSTGNVISLAEDSEGGIWSASSTGVARFQKGLSQQILPGFAASLINVGPGVLLASVGPQNRGFPENPTLYRLKQVRGSWKAEKIAADLAFQGRLSRDRSGNVLFPCKGGFCELNYEDILSGRARTSNLVSKHEFPTPGYGRVFVLRDHFDCVWSRSEEATNYQCPGQSTPQKLGGSGGTIREAPNGSVLLPAFDSFTIGRPGAFRSALPRNGLPSSSDAVLAADGTVWLAAPGLVRMPSPFHTEYWNEHDGFEGEPWSTIRIQKRIFTAAGPSILALSVDRTRWFPFARSPDGEGIQFLIAGERHGLYALLHGKGVAQFGADGRLLALPGPGQIQGYALARTADRELWLSGPGVMRVHRQLNQMRYEAEDLPANHANGLYIGTDTHDTLWACYDGGLVSRQPTGWRAFSTNDGLLENNCRSFAIDAEEDIWYAYSQLPAFSLIQPATGGTARIQHFHDGPDTGIALSYFFGIDNRGWIWRGTRDGVYAADLNEAKRGMWVHLGDADGLPDVDTNQQSFFGDSDGSIWFGADRSLIHFYPPPDFVHPTKAPNMFISGFSWNGGAPQLAETVHQIPHGASVMAHIGSLQFDRRSLLRLRYRILPEQKSWRDERHLDLDLGRLSWGGHSLEVQARLADGPWSPVASQSFEIGKPIWLSWQMLFALTLSTLALFASGYAWSLRLAERARRQLPDLADWRMAALIPGAHELTGSVLDSRYEVGHLLASGGFAMVFNGSDLKQDGCRCAIKVFHREVAGAESFIRGFRREVAILEQVQHPNVVRIYGHGMTPGALPYLVMEFVEGTTLRDALAFGALPPQRVASLLLQAGDALDAIHALEIYHRDLKPENIMVRSTGPDGRDLVLIDFSIAIVKLPKETIHGLSRAAGSIDYMAPEQTVGYADATTDIYSLAKVTLEMLTGKRLSQLLPDGSLDLPERVTELAMRLPIGMSSDAAALLGSALEFDPRKRPPAASQFAQTIAAGLERSNPASDL